MRIVEIFVPLYLDGEKTKYFISDAGRVMNGKTKLILKPGLSKKGRYLAHLSHNKKSYTIPVHILVATHFIPNPENKPTVNHKIGGPIGKLNNNVENLEWATHDEQYEHARLTGLFRINNRKGTEHGMCKYTEEQIHQVCKLLEENKLSQIRISKLTGVPTDTIRNIRKRKQWTIISSSYDIDGYDKASPYSKEYLNEIDECIMKGMTPKDIRNKFNLPKSTRTKSFLYYRRQICKKKVQRLVKYT